jgi:hypothetical protein
VSVAGDTVLRTLVWKRRPHIPASPEVAPAVDAEVLLRLPEAHSVGATLVADVVVLNVVVLPTAHGTDRERPGRRLRQRDVATTGAGVATLGGCHAQKLSLRCRRAARHGRGSGYAAVSPFESVSGVGYKLTEAS